MGIRRQFQHSSWFLSFFKDRQKIFTFKTNYWETISMNSPWQNKWEPPIQDSKYFHRGSCTATRPDNQLEAQWGRSLRCAELQWDPQAVQGTLHVSCPAVGRSQQGKLCKLRRRSTQDPFLSARLQVEGDVKRLLKDWHPIRSGGALFDACGLRMSYSSPTNKATFLNLTLLSFLPG